MQFPHFIDIAVFDVMKQRNVDCRSHRITFYETYIEYDVDFDADQPQNDDMQLPWERRQTFNYCCIKKQSIDGVQLFYMQQPKLWRVVIIARQDHSFYFKIRTKAQAFTETIKQYILL